jgi:hypothetical protein
MDFWGKTRIWFRDSSVRATGMLQTTVFRHCFPNKITSYRNFSDYTLKGAGDMHGGRGVGKTCPPWLIMTVCRSWHRMLFRYHEHWGFVACTDSQGSRLYWSMVQLLYVLWKVQSTNNCISPFLHIHIIVYLVVHCLGRLLKGNLNFDNVKKSLWGE